MDGTLKKDLSMVGEGIGGHGSRQIRFQDGQNIIILICTNLFQGFFLASVFILRVFTFYLIVSAPGGGGVQLRL